MSPPLVLVMTAEARGVALQEPAHHGAAHYHHGVGHGRAARGGDTLAHRRAHGHSQNLRRGHLAGDGDVFVGQGLAVQGAGHGIQRGHVGHHRPNLLGQPQGRNGLAGDLVHENLLVPGGVEIVQPGQLDARPGHGLFEDGGLLDVLGLDGQNGAARAHGVAQGGQPAHHVGSVVQHHRLVRIQKRLALAAVGDDRLHLAVVLDVGRESRPALADDARFADRLHQRFLVHASLCNLEDVPARRAHGLMRLRRTGAAPLGGESTGGRPGGRRPYFFRGKTSSRSVWGLGIT